MIKINMSVTVNDIPDGYTSEYSEELIKWNPNITIKKTNPSEIILPKSIKVEYKNTDVILPIKNESNSSL